MNITANSCIRACALPLQNYSIQTKKIKKKNKRHTLNSQQKLYGEANKKKGKP